MAEPDEYGAKLTLLDGLRGLRHFYDRPKAWSDTFRPIDVLTSDAASGFLEAVVLNGCRSDGIGKRIARAGIPVVCWETVDEYVAASATEMAEASSSSAAGAAAAAEGT